MSNRKAGASSLRLSVNTVAAVASAGQLSQRKNGKASPRSVKPSGSAKKADGSVSHRDGGSGGQLSTRGQVSSRKAKSVKAKGSTTKKPSGAASSPAATSSVQGSLLDRFNVEGESASATDRSGSPLHELLSERSRVGPVLSDRSYSNSMSSVIEVDFPLGTTPIEEDEENYEEAEGDEDSGWVPSAASSHRMLDDWPLVELHVEPGETSPAIRELAASASAVPSFMHAQFQAAIAANDSDLIEELLDCLKTLREDELMKLARPPSMDADAENASDAPTPAPPVDSIDALERRLRNRSPFVALRPLPPSIFEEEAAAERAELETARDVATAARSGSLWRRRSPRRASSCATPPTSSWRTSWQASQCPPL